MYNFIAYDTFILGTLKVLAMSFYYQVVTRRILNTNSNLLNFHKSMADFIFVFKYVISRIGTIDSLS